MPEKRRAVKKKTDTSRSFCLRREEDETIDTHGPHNPHPKKLLDQVRDRTRVKHYSRRTEEAYVNWIRRYILFHNTRHPQEMGVPEVEAFLTHLAVEGKVAASTQN